VTHKKGNRRAAKKWREKRENASTFGKKQPILRRASEKGKKGGLGKGKDFLEVSAEKNHEIPDGWGKKKKGVRKGDF